MENTEQNFTVECRVCGHRYENWVGSTPCCGSLASLVNEDGTVSDDALLFGATNGTHGVHKVTIPKK